MRPSTRKRKEPPSNRTLLDFFPDADAIKQARVKTPRRLTPSARQTIKVSSREIIVIDSDSDDGIEMGKRDVRQVSEEPQPPSSVASTPAHSEAKVVFGTPSELLGPSNSRVVEVSDNGFHTHQQPRVTPRPGSSESVFGVSAPFLEEPSVGKQLSERCQVDFVSHENTFAMRGSSPTNGTANEFSVAEWAVGDDELVSLEALDNSFKSDESEEEHSDKQLFCPVCNVGLTSDLVTEAEIHVNECLDTTLQSDCLAVKEYTLIAVSTKSSVTSDNQDPSSFVKGQRRDLYSALMDSRKENEAWAEADAAADRDFGATRENRRRTPFYKILQGMPIAVDAFCYGTIPSVTAYFLTHAHSDHYTNLGSKWKSGPIYCSEETANLITHMLAVDPSWIHPLPLDTPTIVPDTGGVSVTLIEANHCPGSCLFFFEGRQTTDAGDTAFKSPFVGSSRTFRYLHCGDFRASPRHIFHPAVKGKQIDHIYLDTTYLDPKYTFSPQPLVISACAELTRKLVAEVGDNPNPQTNQKFTIDSWIKPPASFEGRQQMPRERILVVVGTYSVGKERIVKAIAQALEAKIYCDSRKSAILRCQADKELHALLAANPAEADVHILPLGMITSDHLKSYLHRFSGIFSRVIGFRPTGWTYSPLSGIVHGLNSSIQSIISCGRSRQFTYADLQPSQKSSHNVQIFGVPYSEHSSFFELTCFAMSCDWGRIIPTVNVGNPISRAKMTKWLKRWELEKKRIEPSFIQPRTPDYW